MFTDMTKVVIPVIFYLLGAFVSVVQAFVFTMLTAIYIALAISRIPEFLTTAGAALKTAFPTVHLICFGHLGDGNLHYNAFIPGRERSDIAARAMTDVNRIVHDIVQQFGGSISAEHGIGQSKRDELAHYKSATELDLMRMVKKAIDPRNLMNPGKVL